MTKPTRPAPPAKPDVTTAATRVQMADIARLAGVSKATVSRALSGSPLIGKETRERIEELARSLNYAVDAGAKKLRTRQNRTVAVVIPYDKASRQPISDPFFLAMVGSLADALTDIGCDMLLSRIDADNLDAAVALVNSGVAMGVILIGQWHLHEQLNALAARRFPIVVWGAQTPRQIYCTVGGDNVAGGHLATAHLLAQGHRRIVFIGDTSLPEVEYRHRGYLAAHEAHGVQADPKLHLNVPFNANDARAGIRRLCESGVVFDAVFAGSDVLASAAMQALHLAGRAVPAEVAVIGYDDIDWASHANPPLTTVRQPIVRAGVEMVQVLLDLIGGNASAPRTLPVELVVRASTSPRRRR